jgi:hypothetical protein
MGSFSSPLVFMATTITTTITLVATTTLSTKETQEVKTKKNLPLSTFSDKE